MTDLQEEFQRVSDIMYEEGIGYYLLDYTDSSSMPDKESKKLFEEATRAIQDFEEYIKIKRKGL